MYTLMKLCIPRKNKIIKIERDREALLLLFLQFFNINFIQFSHHYYSIEQDSTPNNDSNNFGHHKTFAINSKNFIKSFYKIFMQAKFFCHFLNLVQKILRLFQNFKTMEKISYIIQFFIKYYILTNCVVMATIAHNLPLTDQVDMSIPLPMQKITIVSVSKRLGEKTEIGWRIN